MGTHESPRYRHAHFMLILCSFWQKPCSFFACSINELYLPFLKMLYMNISAYRDT